jgi:hypothetical protein
VNSTEAFLLEVGAARQRQRSAHIRFQLQLQQDDGVFHL